MRLLNRLRVRLALRTRLREVTVRARDQRLHRRLAGPKLLAAFADAYPSATFVEIGSNDGEQYDHLRTHILSRDWSGVMVEPVPYVFERLRANYAALGRVALENAAVGPEDATLPFFHLVDATPEERAGLPTWYDGIGSFSREGVLGHVRDIPDIVNRLVTVEVQTLTLESLCNKHGIDDIDLLVIDTEGHDWEILRSVDFSKARPRVVVYEHFHLSDTARRAALAHVQTLGYRVLEEGFDTFCFDPLPDDLTRRLDRLRPALPAVTVRDEAARMVISGEASAADRRYLTTLHDERTPLPPGAAERLRTDHPRLTDLRLRYAALDLPVLTASRWSKEAVASFLDLERFRGETLITWHYRELPRITELKFFTFARYVADRDGRDLLATLGEDGAFGCWWFGYPGHVAYSRDLLESVNEISFLDRQLGILGEEGLRVLDIGAGYGRLAHRLAAAAPGLVDYCCVDAVPESTFICEYYLEHRKVTPPARVVALDQISDELTAGGFDLAVNIHSFSECTYAAVAWWIQLLADLDVPRLLLVPNEPHELLSLETDGTRRDFAGLLAVAGYELLVQEPVIDDPAVRALLDLHDRFQLYERQTH